MTRFDPPSAPALAPATGPSLVGGRGSWERGRSGYHADDEPRSCTQASRGARSNPVGMIRSTELEVVWERLLDEHGAALRRVAAAYEADPSRRDDLFQDICLAVWRALPGFRAESSERTFVFRIAHNRGSTHGFRQKNRAAIEGPALDDGVSGSRLRDPGDDPEATTLALDRQRRLLSAIRRLPLAARQVLTLTLEGIPQREIAEILGLSESNVAVRLHRARKAIRRQLAAEEGQGPVRDQGSGKKGSRRGP